MAVVTLFIFLIHTLKPHLEMWLVQILMIVRSNSLTLRRNAMTFNYRIPSAFMGATTLVLLLSGFKGISHSPFTTSHLVYSGLGASAQNVGWLGLPMPSPPVERQPAGSRDSMLCLLTPGNADESVTNLWSATPQFVWAEKFLEPGIHSSVARVVVVLPESQAVVWSQQVPTNLPPTSVTQTPWRVQQMAYNGDALQPGQIYEWFLLDRRNHPLESGAFQVMATAEQQAIGTALATLTQSLSAKQATPEDIAAEKAFYFAEQYLWSEALQVTFSVETPSPELVEFQHQLPNQICGRH
jgi:hypothetical protein